jgi:hypothetical protein
VLERRGLAIKSVEQPRRRLEALFLDIVDQARREGVQTSGARNGGRIADFLRDGAADVDGEGDEAADMLEQLAARPVAAAAAMAPPSAMPSPAEPSPLDQLVASEPARPSATARSAAEPTAEPPQQPDDDMLSSLVRKP